MRFYLCQTAEGRKRLITRQDEAKKLDKSCELIDIPVDQAGIKAGYEELFDKIFDIEHQFGGAVPAEAPEQEPSDGEAAPTAKPAVQSAPVHFKAPKPDDGSKAIIDWIFDHATNSQVCDVFLGLSSRYSEMVKKMQDDERIDQ